MNRNRIIALLLIAAVALVAALPASAKLRNVKDGFWEIDVAYPRFESSGAVAASLNATCKSLENSDYNFFLKRAKTEIPVVRQRRHGEAAQYDMMVIPTISLDSKNICSAYVERYVYTAGAHGNTTFLTWNRALIGKSNRNVKLQDLFKKGVDGVAQASAAVLARLSQRESPPSSVADGTWKKLTPEQAQRFNITPSGLLFLFGSYELGPYAEGTTRVLVPWSSLPGLNTGGFIKPVLVEAKKSQVGILTTGRWTLQFIEYSDEKSLTSTENDTNWVEFRKGTVNGRAGVNTFRGPCTAKADGTLKVGPLVMTRAANPEGSVSEAFQNHIGEVNHFLVDEDRLVLNLARDTGIMVFEW